MERIFITGGSGFVGRNLIKTLREQGFGVRATARSSASERVVHELGAEPVSADLDAVDRMAEGMRGCSFVVHAAAKVEEWGALQDFFHVNVMGTENVLQAARKAGVPRLVHVSTEAVLLGSGPLAGVDETRPRAQRPPGLYPYTKALAEDLVLAASGNDLTTVAVRPRFIWGRDDTSLLPKLIDTVRTGRFAWIGGGRYLTSTCHVANLCEGILCTARHGRGGHAYFLTDGPPVEVRAFLSAMLRTQGVEPPTRSIPRALASPLAALTEDLWTVLRLESTPPLTRTVLGVIGQEVTVDDRKARNELGYREIVTREQGLAELSELRVSSGSAARTAAAST